MRFCERQRVSLNKVLSTFVEGMLKVGGNVLEVVQGIRNLSCAVRFLLLQLT